MQETQLIFAVIGYGCLGIAAGYSFTVLIAVLAWRLYCKHVGNHVQGARPDGTWDQAMASLVSSFTFQGSSASSI